MRETNPTYNAFEAFVADKKYAERQEIQSLLQEQGHLMGLAQRLGYPIEWDHDRMEYTCKRERIAPRDLEKWIGSKIHPDCKELLKEPIQSWRVKNSDLTEFGLPEELSWAIKNGRIIGFDWGAGIAVPEDWDLHPDEFGVDAQCPDMNSFVRDLVECYKADRDQGLL